MLAVPYLAELIYVVLSGTPFPFPERAVPLLLGIAAQESGLEHTRQHGGPARGYWQIEPATERSHWHWLTQKPLLAEAFVARCGVVEASVQALQHNIPYQILLARLHFYRRDPQPLPEADHLKQQAQRWKTYYNTFKEGGNVEDYLATWERLIQPFYIPRRMPRTSE